MGLLSGKSRRTSASSWIRLATLGLILSIALQVVSCESEPTESQCRPYIEKALKQQFSEAEEKLDTERPTDSDTSTEQEEGVPTDELTETIEESDKEELEVEGPQSQEGKDDAEKQEHETEETEVYETKEEFETDEPGKGAADAQAEVGVEEEVQEEQNAEERDEAEGERIEEVDEAGVKKVEQEDEIEGERAEQEDEIEGERAEEVSETDGNEEMEEVEKIEEGKDEKEQESASEKVEHEGEDETERAEQDREESVIIEGEETTTEEQEEPEIQETQDTEEQAKGEEQEQSEAQREQEEPTEEDDKDITEVAEKEEATETRQSAEAQEEKETEVTGEGEDGTETTESQVEPTEAERTEGETGEKPETTEDETVTEPTKAAEDTVKIEVEISEESATKDSAGKDEQADEPAEQEPEGAEPSQEGDQEPTPEEDLIKEVIIPENLRPRDHITKILRLDEDSVETESVLSKAIDSTLKSLKTLYDNAIKPLEMLYKYRDLSNRHFGDPEIFSKPLILFMGPWSGGKSSTINYLLDNEYTQTSLRTGAEPSPAYFNILMYGKEEEILDGTQLAADWTFSGLQKFGQGLLDRLKGYKLPSRLLEKVNIVEIPGILEIRKQVQRLFPFNDACQWFIDRADIIFLVYDPSKLDVGPETEAILDQLKGREYQTRIILNKADQVKPEELMRVQGTLIWNISPLMSSSEPPIMYTTSLWSIPYETGAPTRLLLAQERAFLRDLREAIDKRVENKIASARRFAVRVRNHAKMVDCYLTTYYNHKTFFGNRKKISDDIIENPQKYHIYEGLSTLTNISRYDLPDPDVYRDFFKINPLYDFTKLSDTCTYFRGCPINKLDVAIAYDLPELVGKYKKAVEASKAKVSQKTNS